MQCINLGGTAEVYYKLLSLNRGMKAFFTLWEISLKLPYKVKNAPQGLHSGGVESRGKEGNHMFPNYEEAKKYEKEYNMIPVCKEIYADIVTPITLLRRLKEIDSKYYLLESVEGGKQWGRYSFLGVNPLLQIRSKKGIVTMKSGAMVTEEKQDAMEALRKLLGE